MLHSGRLVGLCQFLILINNAYSKLLMPFVDNKFIMDIPSAPKVSLQKEYSIFVEAINFVWNSLIYIDSAISTVRKSIHL